MSEREIAASVRGTARIGVVLVNWRGVADTAHCVKSLVRASPPPACVVVIENGSGDDSVTRLRSLARTLGVSYTEGGEDDLQRDDQSTAPGWLTLVPLGENRGFSGGNNPGLRLLHARSDVTHFLLLNNDTEVAPDYFAALERALVDYPQAALLGGTIYHFDDRDRVWYAGGAEFPLRALVVHRTARPATDAVVPTEFVTGCALLVSRAAFEHLGGLPECYYPGYMEDAEYCHVAREAGLQVLYAPGAVVYHKIGAASRTRERALLPTMLTVRHRAFFARRNLRGVQRAASLAYLAVTKSGRIALELLRGRPDVARAMLHGTLSGLFSPAARGAAPGVTGAPSGAARARSR